MKGKLTTALLVGGVLCSMTGNNGSASASLITSDNFAYQGAFRVPQGPQGISSFGYGGSNLAFRGPNGFNGANGSLFMVGQDIQQKVAEISIPQLATGSDWNRLNIASILQPFADVTHGNLTGLNNVPRVGGACDGSTLPVRSTVGGPCGQDIKIGGLLVQGDRLLGTSYDVFDAGTPFGYYSHFVSDLGMTNFRGMFRLDAPISGGADSAGFVAGWMANIPLAWQGPLGGTVLTGQGGVSIISRSSVGPAAFVFDSQTLADPNTAVSATPLLYYPLEHQNLGSYITSNSHYNGASQVKGVVFPDGTDSVLFFGRRGTGPYCYGAPTANPALAFTCVTPGAHYDYSQTSCADAPTVTGNPYADVTAYCYDPVETDYKGPHAYPYVAKVWAYDANDFLAVKNGTKNPYDVLPYAEWDLPNLPFAPSTRGTTIRGAAYDPQTKRVYISQWYGNNGNEPVIYAFQVTTVAADTTPPAVSVASPSNPASLSGTVLVAATASDNVAIARVDLYVNGALQGTVTTAPYNFSWDTTKFANGTYTVMAKAYDPSGNMGASAPVTVTVNNVASDNIAPSVSMINPANGSTVSGSVSVTCNATDNVGVTKVETYLNGALIAVYNTTPYSNLWDTTQYPNGNYALSVKAYDAAGNVGTSSLTVNVKNWDTTAPVLTSISPADGTKVGNGNVAISASASDNIAVTQMQLWVDGALQLTTQSSSFVWNLNAKNYSKGSHTVLVKAFDAANNVVSKSITINK